MFDYVTSFEFMSMLALFVYWIPLAICVPVYLFRIIGLYKSDLGKSGDEYYKPDLTVGLIVWWAICSVTPAINLFALVFDCASSVFKWLGKFLDIPLVARKR
jgi:hypothetical protein